MAQESIRKKKKTGLKTILQKIFTRWDELCAQGERASFHRGQILFYKGHLPAGLFVLYAGSVSFKTSKIKKVMTQTPSILGLHELVKDAPHSTTCFAKSDVESIFIPKSALLSYLQSL